MLSHVLRKYFVGILRNPGYLSASSLRYIQYMAGILDEKPSHYLTLWNIADDLCIYEHADTFFRCCVSPISTLSSNSICAILKNDFTIFYQ